jgi:predicted outer membrane repeat protein
MLTWYAERAVVDQMRTDTTFGSNVARTGGAVSMNRTRMTATNVAFGDNSADDGGAVYSTGTIAGVAHSFFESVVFQRGATRANCTFNDAPGPISNGYNLADDDSCALTEASDLQNTDPLLVALADNGGPTATHALLPGSPTIDSGNPTKCTETDQRGATRLQDGDGDGMAVCDRGAVEMSVMTGDAVENALQFQSFEREVFEHHADEPAP